MRYALIFSTFVLLCLHGTAQVFDIDQPSQFFRPRVKLESEYFFAPSNRPPTASYLDFQSLVTFPVNTSIKGNLLDVLDDGINLKKIKNDLKIRFSQQMISVRAGYKTLYLDTGATHYKTLYNGSLGFFGFHSLKKLNVLFYTANVNFNESVATLSKLRAGFNLVVGNVKIMGLKQYYIYGVYLGFVNNRFLPIPFLGVSAKIAKHSYLSIVLPAYLGYAYSKNKLTLNIAAGVDGFRTGIANAQNTYTNFSMGGLSFYQNTRYKIGKGLWLKCETGILFKSSLNFATETEKTKLHLPLGYYANIGINYNFGRLAAKQINLLELL